MDKKHSSQMQSIKKKLMAATSMLLVACIMMVSSTYAWFTLSTAPEITGITTTVGANGSLEIALADATTWADPDNLVTAAVGDSMANQDVTKANITWGNLVDLSSTTYGLQEIVLYPSKLNIGGDNKVQASPLSTPSYGTDGRVKEVTPNTYTGLYDAEANVPSFVAADKVYGVRGVGSSTGMSDRQIAYRSAKSNVTSNAGAAKIEARKTLETYGNDLADIVIKKATGGADSYTEEQVETIGKMLTGLSKAMGYVETALQQALLAEAASAQAQAKITDEAFATYANVISSLDMDKLTISGSDVTITDDVTITASETWTKALDTYLEAVTSLTTAQNNCNNATPDNGDGTYSWTKIGSMLTPLVNYDNVTVNGITTARLKEDLGQLVSAVTGGQGINVELRSGSGLFADISDLCGVYSASITMEEISYGELTVPNVTAKMVTIHDKNHENYRYFAYFDKEVEDITLAGSPSSEGSSEAVSLTDMYGYIIDFYLRTNAQGSDLILETDALQRVYSDSVEENTQGGGSYMAFNSSDNNFGTAGMTGLMDSIRLVFMDGDSKVLAYGKLDTSEGALTSDAEHSLKAPIKLYTAGETTTVTETTCTNHADSDSNALCDNCAHCVDSHTDSASDGKCDVCGFCTGSHVDAKATDGSDVADGKCDTCGATVITTTTPSDTLSEDNVLCALSQNIAQKISVLVYLDGETVTNADVATAAQSMAGKLNLQFSSSAPLTPMENAALKGMVKDTTQDSGNDNQSETPPTGE